MGASESVALAVEDVEELSAETGFSPKEIQRLYRRFKRLDKEDKGTISADEFLSIPELAMNPLAMRVISLFAPPPRLPQPPPQRRRAAGAAAATGSGGGIVGSAGTEVRRRRRRSGAGGGGDSSSDGSDDDDDDDDSYDDDDDLDDAAAARMAAAARAYPRKTATGSHSHSGHHHDVDDDDDDDDDGTDDYDDDDDDDGTDEVNFRRFARTLAVFRPDADPEEKLRFAFRVYDLRGDGFISREELLQVLKMLVGTNLTDDQLHSIVDKTLIEADKTGDGLISFDEFASMVSAEDAKAKLSLKF